MMLSTEDRVGHNPKMMSYTVSKYVWLDRKIRWCIRYAVADTGIRWSEEMGTR
jgi:hypothetical protein